MNMSSVHKPRPVSLSGVRFAVKLTPHGPANAVLVADEWPIHGPCAGGAGGMTKSEGCPVRARDRSISGPRGPIFQGVWQSLQPMVLTRFAPRSTRALSCSGAAAPFWAARAIAPASIPEATVIVSVITVVITRVGLMAE